VVVWLVKVHGFPMGLLHVDQLQPPQVSNNDFMHLGCLSKCASIIEQHPI
jgi:hypothetical protein